MTTSRINRRTFERLRRAAAILAAHPDASMAAIARELGCPSSTLRDTFYRYPDVWQDELKQANERGETYLLQLSTLPGPKLGPWPMTIKRIAEAATMHVNGKTYPQIAQHFGLSFHTVKGWQKGPYWAIWKAAVEEAMKDIEKVVKLVRQQAGTDAVLDDPDAFLLRAQVAEKWTTQQGESLLPASEEPTLLTFFESYYLPNRLGDASPSTISTYRGRIRTWALLTGDPPLKDITVTVLARFKACLSRMTGKDNVTPLSPNTIRSYLRQIQVILDKAGPPGRRNRDAAGIIDNPPWVKPPKERLGVPKIVPLELIGDCYLASVCMEKPKVDGFKPAAWWRTLLVVCYNTGLRRGSLFLMRMEYIDWQNRLIVLPPGTMKGRKVKIVHLNDTAFDHLLSIRTDRELVFPWPHNVGHFHRHFHRLQTEAGIPREKHFGLHALRRTHATALWKDSPQAAQLSLDHSTLATTQRHYVDGGGIVAKGLDNLPQPEAFKANGGGNGE